MKAISSAIIVLAGAVMTTSTEGNMSFIHDIGSVLIFIGVIAWLFAYVTENKSK